MENEHTHGRAISTFSLYTPYPKTHTLPKGFVLSFAVLVAGILLSIGLAIFTITLKELILSGSGRESQFAFYAADTGGECALYWDIKHAGFSGSVFGPISYASTTSPPSYGDPVAQNSGVSCSEQDITDPATGWNIGTGWDVVYGGTSTTTIFDMRFGNGTCATVTVIKNSTGITQIDSRGYNTCADAAARRVERGLRIQY